MLLLQIFRWGSLPLVILLLVWALVGVIGGIGGYTFIYAKGGSYLTDDPNACANCHIMREHHEAWQRSSHHAVAVCNDCHTPHDNIVHKYYVKGVNGYNHSFAFTTGRFEDNFQITPFNIKVANESCRHCHEAITHQIEPAVENFEKMSCIRCHQNVGHMQ